MKTLDAVKQISDQHWFIAPMAIVAAITMYAAAVTTRRAPVELIRSEISTEVKPGDMLTVRRFRNWLRSDCSGYESQAVIVDSLGYPHAPVGRVVGDIGFADRMQREIPIPFNMPWGEAKYIGRLAYFCFPFYRLWPIRIEHPPLRFHVSPP